MKAMKDRDCTHTDRNAVRVLLMGLAGLMVSLSMIASSAAVTVADLETEHLLIVGSCPVYDPDSGVGNNPAGPTNPQASEFLFRRGTSVTCQIMVRNKTETTLDGVALKMVFPTETWEVVSAAALPDGDPWYFLTYGENVHVTTVGLHGGTNWSGSPVVPSGYPTGAWDLGNYSYSWIVDGLGPGATREFRLQLNPNYHTDFATDYNVEVVAEYASQTARQVIPARYDVSGTGITVSTAVPKGMLPEDRIIGVHSINTSGVSSYYRRNPNTVLYARLPYYDGDAGVYKADGAYDALNPLHLPAIDLTTLSGNLRFGTLANYDLQAGRLTGPSSGFNADRMIIYNDQTNTVELYLGDQPQHYCCPASNLRFIWTADPSMSVVSGDRLPVQTCYVSDIMAELSCNATQWLDVSDIPYPPTYYMGQMSITETSAPRPTASLYLYPYLGNDSTTTFGQTDIYLQMPGDSEKRVNFGHFYFNWVTTETVYYDIYVSTYPTDYGSEGDLSARVVPSTPPDQWVKCNTDTSWWCQTTDLTRLGIAPEDVTEIRLSMPYFDPSVLARGTTGASNLQWQVHLDRSARGSIDGSSFNRNDMTRSSFGMKTVLRYEHEGVVEEVADTMNWELNRASLYNGFRACHDGNNQDVTVGDTVSFWITQSCTALTTGFRNTGGLENIWGPIDIWTTLPEGFEYDNSAYYPLEPSKPKVFQVRYGGGVEEWTGFVDYAFDEMTRELYVTLIPDNPEQAFYPSTRTWASGEIVGFFIEVQGQVLFGAPRDLKTSNTRAKMFFEDGMGVKYEADIPASTTTEGHYLVGTTSALSLSGMAEPTVIGGGEVLRHFYSLSNPAFEDSGEFLENGATGEARQVVLYERVTKPGDYPAVEDGGFALAVFDFVSSSDALELYISAEEEPVRDHGGTALSEVNGWKLCDPNGALCTAAMAAGLVGSAENVRWVAINFGDVLITDSEPRGTAPIDGATRVNVPYTATVQLLDGGSTGGATIRSIGRLYSQDDLPRVTPTAALDVFVDSLCGAISCASGQACIDEVCYELCETDLDCFAPDICLDGVCATDLCMGVECGPGETCHGGTCFAECGSTADCPDGLTCFEGRCAEYPCDGVVCVDGQFCFGGGCADPCLGDGDCSDGLTCISGRCAETPCDGISCESDLVCHQGACFPPCNETHDCTGAEECFDNTCRVAICGDWSDCAYEGGCDTTGESVRQCQEFVCDIMGYCDDYAFTDSTECFRHTGCPTQICEPACPGNQLCWGGTCFPSGCDQGNLCSSGEKCIGFPYDDEYNRCVPDEDDGCGEVTCVDICHEGGCFDGCTRNSDCAPGEKCFEGRCGTNQCDFIQCDVGLICRGGKCKAECTANSDCAAGQKCYGGACKADPCDGYECGEDESCWGESCFYDCLEDVDCPVDGEFCIAGRCTPDACHNVTCALGELCYEGGCFVDCSEDELVCDPEHACYDGRCALDACHDVQCLLGWSCYEGSCFPECTDDLQCDEDHYCYDGRCAMSACSGVSCVAGSTCYEGTCFPECTEDEQCDEDHYCYDGRCAMSACDGIQCLGGQVCYEGTCFQVCTTDDECDADNEFCYNGRCAESACEGVQCREELLCYGGTCFQQCTTDDECDEDNHHCYNGRCAEDHCDGVQCGTSQTCFWGTCFTECNMTSCDPGHECYSGRCTDDPCEAVMCDAGNVCYQGSCFQVCSEDDECDEDNHYCYNGRCAPDACFGVDCPVGMDCYLGSCFVTCSDDLDCTEVDEACYNERCAPDPCHGVECREGFTCVEGSCLWPCGDEDDCDPEHHCYQGYCRQLECDVPDAVRCHAGQVCHMGTCFYECSEDDHCDAENSFCFDGRCATDSCAAMIEGYDDDDSPHLYRTLGGYWPTLSQRSLPLRRPRPLVHSGSLEGLVATLPQVKKAGVVLYLDETEKYYGLALFHGRNHPSQGQAGATYSVRYWGLDDDPKLLHRAGTQMSLVFKDDDDFTHHQIQMHTAGGGTGGLGGVILGKFPVDESWTVQVSAAFRGDIDEWLFYSAETGEWLELDLREMMELINVPIPDEVRLSQEVGVADCRPTTGTSSTPAEGICGRGTVESCRYGYLECAQTVMRWSFEACDGRDTTCDGVVDGVADADEVPVYVPTVYVRQDGTLSDWTRWSTVDKTGRAFEFLNYRPHDAVYGDGSAAMIGINHAEETFAMQAGDTALVLFHRDMSTGILTMPMVHGARVTGSFPADEKVEHQLEFNDEFGSPYYDYSDLMFVSWFDDWGSALASSGSEGLVDDVPMTVKTDEVKLQWNVRRIDVDGSPGREADTATLQLMWHTPENMRPLHFVVDPGLPSSLDNLRLYRNYAALRYLDPGKKFEVKVAWVPIEESMCMSDTSVDGCRGVPYVCIDGKLTCPTPTDETCHGCRDRDGDGYDGYDAEQCPEGDDCNDDPDDPMAPRMHPGMSETCDGLDTNCDGFVDAIGPAAIGESCPDGMELCGPFECGYRLLCTCDEDAGGDGCYCSTTLEDGEHYTSGQKASWRPAP